MDHAVLVAQDPEAVGFPVPELALVSVIVVAYDPVGLHPGLKENIPFSAHQKFSKPKREGRVFGKIFSPGFKNGGRGCRRTKKECCRWGCSLGQGALEREEFSYSSERVRERTDVLYVGHDVLAGFEEMPRAFEYERLLLDLGANEGKHLAERTEVVEVFGIESRFQFVGHVEGEGGDFREEF